MNSLTSLNTYKTSVNLKELNPDGEDFHFTNQGAEITKSISDLVGKHQYNVNLHLQPMGNVFEITGQIATEMTCPCARCGRDVSAPINDSFSEIIVVMDERPRAGHSGHTGSQLDEGPFCNYTTSYQFNLAEFVREHIASAEPYAPHCDRPDCEQIFMRAQGKISAEPLESNPFQVLKNLSQKN